MSFRATWLADQKPPEQIFAVIGWGCSGSKWFARVLNDIPGVQCTHELALSQALYGTRIKDLDFTRMLGAIGSASIAVGDVGSIDPQSLLEIRKEWGSRFKAVTLTRNPFRRMATYIELMKTYHPHLDSGEVFYSGIRLLDRVVEEAQAASLIKIEDLIHDAGALQTMANFLVGFFPSMEWADSATRTPAKNHRAKAELTRGQKREIIRHLSADAQRIYAELDYDLDFEKEVA